MASSRRKQDEKHLKILRELVSKPSNRTCFDCQQKGPTYINMAIGSFVCTSCSGILRGLNPPHRVKSISMASFTSDEVEQIKSKGNQYCQAVWLGLYDNKSNIFPDTKDEHKIRDFMISKYEKKRFYVDPSVALKNGVTLSSQSSESSSSASTPGSDNKSLGSANASSIAGVSRPTANIQNPVSSPSLNGLNPSALKASSSVDLLSGLSTTSPPHTSSSSSAQNNQNHADGAFNSNAVSQGSSQGFANFDNANIFSSSSITKPSPNPSHHLPPPPFSFNPLSPLSSSSKAVSTSIPNNVGASSSNPSEDRYAALKDLDEAFKFQKEPAGNPAPVFGSPPQAPNPLFGTSPVTSGGGFFPPQSSTSSSSTAPAPPSTQGWNAFPAANPFTGTVSSNTASSSSPWANGGSTLGGSPSAARVHPQQANPFAGGTDPNFNSHFISGFGAMPYLNAGPPAGPPAPHGPPGTGSTNSNNNISVNGGPNNWSNFGTGGPTPSQNGATSKLNTNPWGPTSPPNPFNVTPVVPSSGSSYNPFFIK